MATYYWVGGTGTWSGTGNTQFAITSGGVATALNPTTADTVNFDANSGTAATVTVTSTAVAAATTINKADINISLSGNAALGVATGTVTLTTGTLTLNSYKLTTGLFNSNNANARTIAFGTGNITVIGNAGTVWTTAGVTNLTISGTPVVNATYSGSTGTRTFFTGATTEATAISFNVSAGSDIVTISTYAKSINFTGFSGTLTQGGNLTLLGDLTYSTGMTVSAVTYAYTFAATSGVRTITTNNKTIDNPISFNGVGGTWQLQDNMTVGVTRATTLTTGTIDLNGKTLSTGTFFSSSSNIRSIAFNGGSISITSGSATVWQMSTITNFTYTGTSLVNLTYSGSTGTRSIRHGNVPSGDETTAFSFNVSAGSDLVQLSLDLNRSFFKNLNFTGFTGTLANIPATFYGNLIFSSGMTLVAGIQGLTFSATSGTQQITTANKTLDFPLTFNGIGGTFAFQDALTQGSTRAFTITNGTVQLKAGTTNTVGSFVTSGTTQKYLQSTVAGTQATLTKASGTTSVSYLTIKDSSVSGGIWNAYYINSNVDAGNNTLWDFNGYSSYGWFVPYGPDWLNKYGVIKGNKYGVIQDPYFVQ